MTSAAMIRPLGKRALALLERCKRSGDALVAVHRRSDRSAALALVSHGLIERAGLSHTGAVCYRYIGPVLP